MKHGPNFGIVSQQPGGVIIRDLGPWNKFPTITNDAERVLWRVKAEYGLEDSQQLFYYDSDGELTEIRHYKGTFKGFAPVNDNLKERIEATL